MDITAHPRLDPKLKDTYDRIMGTTVGVKTPTPSHPAEKSPDKPVTKTAEKHAAQSQNHGHLSHLAYSAANPKKEVHETEPKPAAPTKSHKGTEDSLLFPILLGAGGVLFFVFYAIFWMSFFGL